MAKKSTTLKKVAPSNTSVGIREMNQQLSQVLKRVKNGNVIEITEHGKLIAKLVPASTPAESLLEELFSSGILVPAKNPEKILEIKPIKFKGKIPLSQQLVNERQAAKF